MLQDFEGIVDKYESLFTIITYNMSVNDIIADITAKINNINTIKNNFKKKYLSERLYNFINWLNENYIDGKINSIFLINGNINEIKLSPDNIKLLKKYEISQFIFLHDNHFKTEYIHKLLYDLEFYDVIKLEKNKLIHTKLNSTKHIIINTFDIKKIDINKYIRETMSGAKSGQKSGAMSSPKSGAMSGQISGAKSGPISGPKPCLVHGVIKDKILDIDVIYNEKDKLTNNEILDIFEQHNMLKIHNTLHEYLLYLNNDKLIDKLIFGNDIVKAILNYKIKTLFCTDKMLAKVRNTIPPEYLNFEIVQVISLNKSDIGDKLQSDFNGIIGIAYY
jgi:hypothetical protein